MEVDESHSPVGHSGDTTRLRDAPPLAATARQLALALEARVWGRRQHDLDCTVLNVQDGDGPLDKLPQLM